MLMYSRYRFSCPTGRDFSDHSVICRVTTPALPQNRIGQDCPMAGVGLSSGLELTDVIKERIQRSVRTVAEIRELVRSALEHPGSQSRVILPHRARTECFP